MYMYNNLSQSRTCDSEFVIGVASDHSMVTGNNTNILCIVLCIVTMILGYNYWTLCQVNICQLKMSDHSSKHAH